MKDTNVEKKVEELRVAIQQVNDIVQQLNENFVEVKMIIREDLGPSKVELFKAVAHVDYLK